MGSGREPLPHRRWGRSGGGIFFYFFSGAPGRLRSSDPGYAFYDFFKRSTMHGRGMEENENG